MAEASRATPSSGRAPVLGIVGGGQLARMIALAAAPLGCRCLILERSLDCPAADAAAEVLAGDWNDPARLLDLARRCDLVTLDNEFVDAAALGQVEAAGFAVRPGAGCLRVVQDKLLQKEALAAAGLPLPPFRDAPDFAAALAAAGASGFPVVLKRRRDGYDGKGNATARSEEELRSAWEALGGGAHPLYVEAWCPFAKELAAIVVRSVSGEEAAYPVVETVQENHICRRVVAPADIPPETAARAGALARRAVGAVGGTGAFGVEMFLLADGGLAVNELAPRVHNSGHYTIEAAPCSQFENHVRAILGWPLGATGLLAPAAAMVNLLGDASGPGWPGGIPAALAIPGARPHLYGKNGSVPGRKMGHVTALGETREEALRRASEAARAIRFGASPETGTP